MIQFFISRLITWFQDYGSENYLQLRTSLLRAFFLAGGFALALDLLIQIALSIISFGEYGQPEFLYIPLLFVAIAVGILSRRKIFQLLGNHILIISFYIVGIRLFDKYADSLLVGVIFTTGIFFLGIVSRPLFTGVYIFITYVIVFTLVAPIYNTNQIESLFLVMLPSSVVSMLSSVLIRNFLNKYQHTYGTLDRLYEGDKELISEFSHRLKTPLTILKAELSQNPTPLGHRSRETVNNAVDDLDKAVNQLTVFSKVQLSSISSRRQRLNLSNFIEQVVGDAQILASNYEANHGVKRTLVYSKKKSPKGAVAKVAADQLREVLLNLIDNSIRHNSEKDNVTVSVSLRQRVSYYSIWVTDNGVGMTEEKVKTIVTGNARSSDFNSDSMHIGLKITNNMVKANNGEMFIYSKLGKGTRVEIKLPVV